MCYSHANLKDLCYTKLKIDLTEIPQFSSLLEKKITKRSVDTSLPEYVDTVRLRNV